MGRRHLTVEERELALRLRAKGLTLMEIGAQLDFCIQTASEVVGPAARPSTAHRTVVCRPFPDPDRWLPSRLSKTSTTTADLRPGATGWSGSSGATTA
jgi:hypothetical protein